MRVPMPLVMGSPRGTWSSCPNIVVMILLFGIAQPQQDSVIQYSLEEQRLVLVGVGVCQASTKSELVLNCVTSSIIFLDDGRFVSRVLRECCIRRTQTKVQMN